MNDSPHSIAGGMAVGVFLGVMPGLGTIAAIIVATLLRLNRGSAILGTLLFNTFTQVPVWIAGYAIGSWLLGESSNDSGPLIHLIKAGKYMHAFRQGGTALIVGFLIATVSVSLLMYLITYKISARYRKHHRIIRIPDI